MGYQLMAAALQPEWGRQLTSTERLVLVIMCQVALDTRTPQGDPGRYFGGTDLLILQTRGDLPPRDSAEYRAASEAIRRALRKLELVGAITRVKSAQAGGRAEYEMTVRQPGLPVDEPVLPTG